MTPDSSEYSFVNGYGFDIERLCHEVSSHRFTMLAAISSLIGDKTNLGLENIKTAFHAIASMPSPHRRFVLADPAFARWLDCTTIAMRRASETIQPIQSLAKALPELLERIKERLIGHKSIEIPGTSILLQRFDIDPIIKEATPPTYDFLAAERNNTANTESAPSTEEFAEELSVAFRNIQECDPVLWSMIQYLVQIIGYLPDCTFRSCSAARYQGVIYLAGNESSIIDLEESIVHEASHQLLYKIAELYPVTTIDASLEETFELPWSGNKRDLFGYFHAYFIYLQLVKYFDHRAQTAGELRPYVERKRELIHRGMQLASEDLAQAKGFTPYGRNLFESLRQEVINLKHHPVTAFE